MKKMAILAALFVLVAISAVAGPLYIPSTNGLGSGTTLVGNSTNFSNADIYNFTIRVNGGVADTRRWVEKIGGRGREWFTLNDTQIASNRFMFWDRKSLTNWMDKLQFDMPVSAPRWTNFGTGGIYNNASGAQVEAPTVWVSTNNNPSEAAPKGSFATVTNGTIWLQTNGAAGGWARLATTADISSGGTSNNVWATIADGGALISSNGTRLFIFNAEPWIGTNYFKFGDPSQAAPTVFQATVRGIQFTDGTGVTNVEANAFNAVASTNTTGWFIGNRLDPANPGRISMTSTGMVFGNAVLAPTNLTARAGTFTSALTFPSGGTGGALLTTADGVAGVASDGSGILLLGNQGQNMWMRPNAYMAVPATCEIGWAVPGANLSGGLSVGFSNSIVGVEAINGSTSRTNFAAAGYFNNTVSVAVGFTLTATNSTVIVTADSQTITLPTSVGIRGRSYTVKSRSAGGVAIAVTSAQTIDGTTPVALTQNQSRTYEADDTGNWIIKSGF